MIGSKLIRLKESITIIKYLLRWTIIILPIAVTIGSMVALFLTLLNSAIHFRFKHSWLLYLLPIAGLFVHFIYHSIGKSSEKGNSLITDEIHHEGGGISKRMTPIIFVTTIITHLFGGSAGREGTAVQMGGSIASMFGKWFGLTGTDMQMVLIAGIAAGFGAVFGTPVTGAIFAIEVLTIGIIKYHALIAAFIASLVGHLTVTAWHVSHIHYHIGPLPQPASFMADFFHLDIVLLGKIIISSVAFGLVSYLFSVMVHQVKNWCQNLFKYKWLIPIFGGLIIIGITLLIGRPDYLSLGVDAEYPGAVTISSAFNAGGAHIWSWLWKSVYTTITLATGFKGGEVTPLFYIGATLGNTLSLLLNAPVSLFAALGFIAVFAGATNTPLACTFMGIELFGGDHVLFFAIACFTAYVFSGHTSVYNSHRIDEHKIFADNFVEENPLAEATRRRAYLHQKFSKYGVFRNR